MTIASISGFLCLTLKSYKLECKLGKIFSNILDVKQAGSVLKWSTNDWEHTFAELKRSLKKWCHHQSPKPNRDDDNEWTIFKQRDNCYMKPLINYPAISVTKDGIWFSTWIRTSSCYLQLESSSHLRPRSQLSEVISRTWFSMLWGNKGMKLNQTDGWLFINSSRATTFDLESSPKDII